jgi:beta-lactam-binding protein with PASTA domain
VGLSASIARRRLLRVGLRVEELVPVAGIPGVVVRTQPAPGEGVSPGTQVTLFIGVEKERLPEQSPSPG